MPERERDDDLERSTNRWITAGIVLTALFALMFPLYRIYEPLGRDEARADLEESLAAQGRELYETTCASCHGIEGEGVDAPALNSQQFLEAADDDQIFSLIAHGVPGSEMAAYSLDFGGPLTSQQINAITTYLRSWEADAPDRPDWRTATADGGDDHGEDEGGDDHGADEGGDDHDEDEGGDDHDEVEGDGGHDEDGDDHDDEEAAFDAAATYATSCARCHGTDLSGGTGPDLGPNSHSVNEPDEHLVEAITSGGDDMPRFENELTAEEIDAMVAYIREVQAGE